MTRRRGGDPDRWSATRWWILIGIAAAFLGATGVVRPPGGPSAAGIEAAVATPQAAGATGPLESDGQDGPVDPGAGVPEATAEGVPATTPDTVPEPVDDPDAGGGATPATGDDAPEGTAAADAPAACKVADRAAPHVDLDDWALTLVDTRYRLPAGYYPSDLRPVSQAGVGGWGDVRSFVLDDLRAMADAARDAGAAFTSNSAFRSYSHQATVFDGWVARAGRDAALAASARAGHSEHQLGTTLDLREAGGPEPWTVDFGATRTGRWLAAHAWEYGFVISYPAGAEARTCYAAEAWHVRYVGREEAAAVHDSGLTLREWLWANR